MDSEKRTYRFQWPHMIVGLLLLVFGVVIADNFISRQLCKEVTLVNQEYSDSSLSYLILSRHIGSPIFDVDKDSLQAELLNADPWIKDVSIRRSILGTIRATVTESQPSARLVDSSGSVIGFVREDGKILPMKIPASFDLPLLRTSRAGISTEQKDFLQALGEVSPQVNALVSEIKTEENGDLAIQTTPSYGRRSVSVKLGSKDFSNKLSMLRAFWDQEFSNLNTTTLEYLDMRFADQVIAKHKPKETQQTS